MSETTTPRTDSLMEEWHHCPPTKQLLNHSRQLERELAEALRESEDRNQQWALKSIYASELEQTVSNINSQLTAHKAALEQSKSALLAITSGHFYQSSCRGGEMERLMNQAIESLSAVNPNQPSR